MSVTSVWSLGAMVLWGALLGFAYQLFLPLTEKIRSLFGAVILYFFSGLICFLITSLFLYVVNGGNWGLYGLISMVLGFGLYHRRFWRIGAKVASYSDHVVVGFGKTMGSVGRKSAKIILYPFGKVVDKGEKWVWKKEEKRRKKRIKQKSDANQQV